MWDCFLLPLLTAPTLLASLFITYRAGGSVSKERLARAHTQPGITDTSSHLFLSNFQAIGRPCTTQRSDSSSRPLSLSCFLFVGLSLICQLADWSSALTTLKYLNKMYIVKQSWRLKGGMTFFLILSKTCFVDNSQPSYIWLSVAGVLLPLYSSCSTLLLFLWYIHSVVGLQRRHAMVWIPRFFHWWKRGLWNEMEVWAGVIGFPKPGSYYWV